MLELHREKKGTLDVYTLKSFKQDCALSIVPSLGGALFQLVLTDQGQSREMLKPWPEQAPKEYYQNAFAGSQLFPFPNRLKNGQSEISNTPVRFELNDFGRPNALHGHIYNQAFEISEWDQKNNFLKCTYTHKASPSFPFDYHIVNCFQLKANSLEIKTTITNHSKSKLPFGYGWHPYFKSSSRVDDLSLALGAKEKLEVDENLIPQGKTVNYYKFEKTAPIGNTELDSCFIKGDSQDILLHDPHKHQTVKIDIEDFDFIQVYIPPERDCIAIEPQTCAPNAFNNKIGLQFIDPQSSRNFRMKISLLTKQ